MKNKKRTLTKDVTADRGKTGRKELQELSHAAVPGYRGAFYVVFAVGVAYLTVILLMS
ncbi:MAG: hypothetical protein QMD32_02600 [Smithellaceae bacterium]|nr:hypothetical protein [Smithellaceae bacterium]